MGRGRKPIPTQILKLKGTFQPCRRNNVIELPPGCPEAPEWLSEIARDEWNRIIGVLVTTGIVTEADLAVMAGYCQSWSDYITAVMDINKNGTTLTSETGVIKPNPALGIMDKAWTRCLRAATELGITPSSRGKVMAGEAKSEDQGRQKYIS